MITAFSCSPYSVQACVCRLLSRSLLPREAAAWMERMSCADSIGLRWPNWDNCTGRDANQRDSTLLLQRETKRACEPKATTSRPDVITQLLQFLHLSTSNVTTKVRQIYFYTTFCLRAKIKLFREATDVIMVSFDFVLCSLGQLRNNYMKKKA